MYQSPMVLWTLRRCVVSFVSTASLADRGGLRKIAPLLIFLQKVHSMSPASAVQKTLTVEPEGRGGR